MNRFSLPALLGALLAAGVAVFVTFTVPWLAPVSGFAAGVFKAALALAGFWAFDRWVLPGDACEEVIEKRNVAYALALVALALVLGATIATAQTAAPPAVLPHVAVAASQVGVTEHGGNNRGPEVRGYLRSVGLGEEVPAGRLSMFYKHGPTLDCGEYVTYRLTDGRFEVETVRARSCARDAPASPDDPVCDDETCAPRWPVVWARDE